MICSDNQKQDKNTQRLSSFSQNVSMMRLSTAKGVLSNPLSLPPLGKRRVSDSDVKGKYRHRETIKKTSSQGGNLIFGPDGILDLQMTPSPVNYLTTLRRSDRRRRLRNVLGLCENANKHALSELTLRQNNSTSSLMEVLFQTESPVVVSSSDVKMPVFVKTTQQASSSTIMVDDVFSLLQALKNNHTAICNGEICSDDDEETDCKLQPTKCYTTTHLKSKQYKRRMRQSTTEKLLYPTPAQVAALDERIEKGILRHESAIATGHVLHPKERKKRVLKRRHQHFYSVIKKDKDKALTTLRNKLTTSQDNATASRIRIEAELLTKRHAIVADVADRIEIFERNKAHGHTWILQRLWLKLTKLASSSNAIRYSISRTRTTEKNIIRSRQLQDRKTLLPAERLFNLSRWVFMRWWIKVRIRRKRWARNIIMRHIDCLHLLEIIAAKRRSFYTSVCIIQQFWRACLLLHIRRINLLRLQWERIELEVSKKCDRDVPLTTAQEIYLAVEADLIARKRKCYSERLKNPNKGPILFKVIPSSDDTRRRVLERRKQGACFRGAVSLPIERQEWLICHIFSAADQLYADDISYQSRFFTSQSNIVKPSPSRYEQLRTLVQYLIGVKVRPEV